MIVDVVLFPGIVTVVEGVIIRPLPAVLAPVQNWTPRLAYCRVKVLLPAPPLTEFHITWTFGTVIESWGFVIVILIVLADVVIAPRVMLPQPGTGVEVAVGVNVMVGVNVIVGVFVGVNVGVTVGVFEGISVGVLLGRGPAVAGIDVLVGIGVSDGIAVSVGVLDGVAGVAEAAGVHVLDEPEPRSTSPRKVRALEEVKVRGLIGINLTMGS